MRPFEYRRAADSAELFTLLDDGAAQPPPGKRRAAWPLAGGTDLIPLLEDRVLQADRLVDIKRMTDLGRGIRVDADGIVIGALTTLAEVADDERLRTHAALLGEAARVAATPQLRAVATVAGNLLQRPRCWYFRNPAFHCWLKGGGACPAREGRNDRHAIFDPAAATDRTPAPADEVAGASPCCAVHPSDLAPCLLALDARVLLRGPGGQRWLDVEDLFALPTPQRRTETVLDGELVAEIRLPPLPGGSRTAYRKAMSRQSWSFALASVAARLDLDDGRIAAARLVLGGVAGVPWRAPEAEALLRGAAPSQDLFQRAAQAALQRARPLRHNAYKLPLTRALVERALADLAA